MANPIRQQRLASFIQRKISAMITSGELKDPRIHSLVMINRVEVSKDLAYAKLFVSSFETPEVQKELLAALNGAAGFVQRELGRELRLRVTPKLRFLDDVSVREGFKVVQKIEALSSKEDPSSEEGEE